MKLDAETSAKIAGFGLICAFFVALLHVPQPVPVDTSTSAWWLFHLTAGTFGRLGVPFYFVAAGFFLARHYGESSWWRRETAKRMTSLFVPFVVWLALWNAEEGALAVLSNLRSGASLFEGFPSGGALLVRLGINPLDYPSDIPLWFVRSLLLYVIASCVFFPALKRTGPLLPAMVLVFSTALRLSGGSSEVCRFLTRFVSLHGLFYFLVGASLALAAMVMTPHFPHRAIFGICAFLLILTIRLIDREKESIPVFLRRLAVVILWAAGIYRMLIFYFE